MKLNWGHYIFISFALFVLLILYMVYRSYQSDNDLVTEDYYAKELKYQNVIEKSKRADGLKQDITWVNDPSGIKIIYPPGLNNIKGVINLYRPSDKDLDFKIDIKQDTSNSQIIPMSMLHRGKYNVQVDWSHESVDYFTEGVVFISE
ncbi:MAG TPA: cytochrome C oxidase Cbb3 [Flavobacteriales bacterium]|nr:cytochrome C oxidase Cbb3 [Flavobacteriales bacterium]